MIMNLLGFDRFTKGKAADGLARAARAPNPFHMGFVGNCKDFWTMGRELGVEYEHSYLDGAKSSNPNLDRPMKFVHGPPSPRQMKRPLPDISQQSKGG